MAVRTRDHAEIRSWAESRGGHPALVEGTEILRIDFEGDGRDERLVGAEWSDFFRIFDDRGLEFLYEPEEESRFNKFVAQAA